MLRRTLTSGASTRQRALQQARHFSQTRSAPVLRAHVACVKPGAAVAFNPQSRALELAQTQRANDHVLSYWKAAALAAGALGALGRLDEQQPAACASSSGKDEDPVEQAKKKLQELATIAMDQMAALLPGDYSNLQKQADEFLASGKGGQLSWGFAMGACAGFALRKMSKLGAVAVGTLFILLQCASYSGYVDVNYKKMERDFKGYLDINKDGVFDTKDLDSMYKSLMKVLEFSLPAGSGFALGFALGFRSG